VYPVNAMGISKAMAEKVMIAKSRNVPDGGPVICATRYGNVMASRGSVIPLFVSQIKAGQSVTVTDPRMTRFLMSLEDSVDLVFHAFEHGRQGDIFIQKAPASTVGDLATALIELLGSTSPVRVIGTRHGEKLHEVLVSREERARSEDRDRYFRVSADDRDLNYEKYFVEGEQLISELDDYTSDNTRRLDVPAIKALLTTLNYLQAPNA
jgi:UDP-N-acetylglucosamine 4,6-dehydratase